MGKLTMQLAQLLGSIANGAGQVVLGLGLASCAGWCWLAFGDALLPKAFLRDRPCRISFRRQFLGFCHAERGLPGLRLDFRCLRFLTNECGWTLQVCDSGNLGWQAAIAWVGLGGGFKVGALQKQANGTSFFGCFKGSRGGSSQKFACISQLPTWSMQLAPFSICMGSPNSS